MNQFAKTLHEKDKVRAEAGIPYVGYPTDRPCDVCKRLDVNQTEPRFGYTVCRHHAHLTPVEVSRLKLL